DDDEDATVNKIALWLCTFSLSVSMGAVLLLPISILSNEILLSFPHSYYMQWLNGSLIHGLWNMVFLFSNLSLVFLLPFAYFFTESEGFAGSKKGLMSRVYETAVELLLLSLLVLGVVWVASALLNGTTARDSLYDLWEYYLPYLYSCISLFGVLLLLCKFICDPPLGAASFSMFGSLGAAVQIILILYLMVSSVVGFYSSPLFVKLLPIAQDTTLTQIIGNCVSLLVLSSALPVFSRTLGITHFDLPGDFGRYNWLGNFHIVFLYNVLFAGLTSACLINTLTWAVQRELIRAFGETLCTHKLTQIDSLVFFLDCIMKIVPFFLAGLHKIPLTVSRSTIPLKLLLANGLSKIN
uniref:Uncharacterized protein n=1 Tax=Denticeps clupeoides TaxID=299321 RepID=A0AAY4CXW4_9TELE